MKKCEWVAEMDCDEFIVFKKEAMFRGTLRTWLSYQPDTVGTISISGQYFGHNGHYNDPSSLVISSFTRRAPSNSSGLPKVISRVNGMKEIMETPHARRAREGFHEIIADHQVIVMHHHYVRSFLRYIHRGGRGDVILMHGTDPYFLSFSFVSSIVAINLRVDTSAAVVADDVVRELKALGIWGTNRSKRLSPYVLQGSIPFRVSSINPPSRIMKDAQPVHVL